MRYSPYFAYVVFDSFHAVTVLLLCVLQTKKESRKLAYNILLNISCTLKETQSTDEESGLQRLLNMVYLAAQNYLIIVVNGFFIRIRFNLHDSV